MGFRAPFGGVEGSGCIWAEGVLGLGVYGVLGVRAFKVWGSGWIGAWGPRTNPFSRFAEPPPPMLYTPSRHAQVQIC